MKFITKIYHPNIDEDGAICVDLLKPDVWKPATKLVNGKKRRPIQCSSHKKRKLKPVPFNLVLQALVRLLETPNPDDALVASIAEIYNANRPKFNKIVKEYVDKVSFTDSLLFYFILTCIVSMLPDKQYMLYIVFFFE